jgi:hypothetical protein
MRRQRHEDPEDDADSHPQHACGSAVVRFSSFLWRAEPGEHVVSCRATDASGEVQPLVQPWNYQRMGNNLVQTVPVSVNLR